MKKRISIVGKKIGLSLALVSLAVPMTQAGLLGLGGGSESDGLLSGVVGGVTDTVGELTELTGNLLENVTALVPATVSRIVGQPLDQTLVPGADAVLAVEVDVAGLQFQWSLNGEYIPGAVGPVIALRNVSAADGGSYRVTVSDGRTFEHSEVAVVVVETPLFGFSDGFASRPLLPAGSTGSVRGGNEGATVEPYEPVFVERNGGHSVWASWVAPESGVATFTTDGSNFDTLLGVYSGAGVRGLDELAVDDESSGYHTSRVQFNAVAGARYEIVVAGSGSAAGVISLNWHLDAGAAALPRVLTAPVNQSVAAGGAVSFAVQAPEAASIQWYHNDLPMIGRNGAVLLLENVGVDAIGQYSVRMSTEPDAALEIAPSSVCRVELQLSSGSGASTAVLAADKPGQAAANGWNVSNSTGTLDQSGTSGRSGTPRRAGRVSYASEGEFMRVTEDGVLPFAAAVGKQFGAVQGYSGTQIFSTQGSGKDLGEPDHCDLLGGASYWFGYQAPENGMLSLNTDESDFDTILAVYIDTGIGDGYDRLKAIACDNDGGQDGRDSAVLFSVIAGQTYYVVIDGVNGASGIATLNHTLTPMSESAAVNYAPITNLDAVEREASSSLKISVPRVLGNDYDPEGGALELIDTDDRSELGARVIRRTDYILYYPRSSSTAVDRFRYTVRDANGVEAEGTIEVHVRP